MKKSIRRDSSHAAPSSGRHGKFDQKSGGRWEFTSSGSLFSLGAIDAVRRVAYRRADGELRFLPI